MRFTQRWFDDIKTTLEQIVPKTARRILEIGSFEGNSALFFLNHCPRAVLTCVDHFRGSRELAKLGLKGILATFAENLYGYQHRLFVFGIDSWDADKALPCNFYDVTFVDGSYVAFDCLHDLYLAYRCTKPNGIIIADDYTFHNERSDCPKIAIDAFVKIAGQRVSPTPYGRLFAMKKNSGYDHACCSS